MICADCNQPIEKGQTTATGPAGEIHHRCFKRGTAHGEEISLFTLVTKIEQLQKRVQDLERQLELTERKADWAHSQTARIGGGG